MAAPVPVKNQDFIATMQVLLVDSGMRLVAAIAILVVGWILATQVKRWLSAGLAHLPLDATLKPLLASLVRYAILIITLILVLEQFGVQTTSLIAVMGAAGLAIGLAMQGTLSNVAAGVMLLILRPFRVGHFVSAGGVTGTVREIGLFTTLLITRDLVFVSVPNSTIFSGVITNFTGERLRRVKIEVPVDHANKLENVEKALLEVMSANKLVLKDPAPSVVVGELQEYAVVMTARAYVRSPDYWTAFYGLKKEIKQALERENILIAVPRQAVEIRNEPETAANAPAKEESPPPAKEAKDITPRRDQNAA